MRSTSAPVLVSVMYKLLDASVVLSGTKSGGPKSMVKLHGGRQLRVPYHRAIKNIGPFTVVQSDGFNPSFFIETLSQLASIASTFNPSEDLKICVRFQFEDIYWFCKTSRSNMGTESVAELVLIEN